MATAALIGWCAWLSVIDVRERRLPNTLTVAGAVAVPLYAACTGRGQVAIAGGLLLGALYLVVHLCAPHAMGAGDVKLAVGLGAAAALAGADAWLLAALLAPVGTAAAGVVALARRIPSVVPHGPSMCAATLIALAAA